MVKMFKMFYLIFLLVSGAATTISSPVDLTPEQVNQISLSLKIPNVDKLEETEELLNNEKRSLEWLKTEGPKFKLFNGEGLVELALSEIEIQRKELELIKTNSEAKTPEVSIEVLEREAKELIERYSKSKKRFEAADVAKVKNWLIRCSLDAQCLAVPESLIPPKSTISNAIELLQKDRDLLNKLALAVKVYRWPAMLSVGHLIMEASPKRTLNSAKTEMLAKMTRIRTGIPISSDKSLIDEIEIRVKLVELFTNAEGNAILTPLEFRERLKSVDFLVGVHLKRKYNHFAVESLTEVDKKMLKEWLFVHQMLYEVDGVSESGGFTIEWPMEFPLKEEYILNNSIRGIDYFGKESEKTPVPDVNVGQPKGVLFPELKTKLDKLKTSTMGALTSSVTGAFSNLFSPSSSKKDKDSNPITESNNSGAKDKNTSDSSYYSYFKKKLVG